MTVSSLIGGGHVEPWVKLLLRVNHSSVVKQNSVSERHKGMLRLSCLQCFNSIIKMGRTTSYTVGGWTDVIPQYTIDSARRMQFKVLSRGYWIRGRSLSWCFTLVSIEKASIDSVSSIFLTNVVFREVQDPNSAGIPNQQDDLKRLIQ